MLAAMVPEDEEPLNTTVVDEMVKGTLPEWMKSGKEE